MAVTKVSSVLACLALARALEGQQQGALRGRVNATILHSTSEAKRGKRRRSACDCMNWAGVYYDSLAMCGRAEELYFLSKFGFSAAYAATEPIAGLPHRVCNDFLKNFKNDSCIMVDQYPFPADAMTNKQWCYVANDCDTLNGGDYATNTMGFQLGGWNNLASTSNLSWKICDPVADAGSMLMNKSPGELLEMCLKDDISCSRIFRLAYPVVEITWGEAQYLLEGLDAVYTPGASLTTLVDGLTAPTAPFTRMVEVHSTIGDIVKSEQGTILDSPGHGDNFHVIKGREVWEVKRIELGDMAYLGGHFSLEFAVTCVMGCAPSRLGNPENPDHPDLDLETM
ncbi:unnamed protein product [Prorocentrum cordatum]|uniref:Uncharacterized protein n=1 Tax=Prorocentrum cordatum TaxID=2364126 RepID=A0ABN9VJ90_9DINO|nr:unnamed protein product [Polarella glacialis]